MGKYISIERFSVQHKLVLRGQTFPATKNEKKLKERGVGSGDSEQEAALQWNVII